MPNTVIVTREEPIAVVRINRPEVRNALNDEVTKAQSYLQRAHTAPATETAGGTGAGRGDLALSLPSSRS